MGLLDLSLKDAANDFTQRIRDPFDKFFASPTNVKAALERNDFKNGFNVIEIQDGRELTREKLQFVGQWMPQVPFTYGGSQKIVKDYYPGNSEPTAQVLGPRENNIVIRGRFKAKRFPVSIGDNDLEEIRRSPEEMTQLVDAMRIRGNLVRIYMGEFQRYGFVENTNFDMRNLSDINYEIEFSIIGFNAPSDCKIVSTENKIPFDINKELITAVNEFQSQGLVIPDSMDRSLASQLRDLISDVATAVNLVTNFVDTVLDEAEALRQTVARAQGLIQNARNNVTRLINRVGSFSSTGGIVFSAPAGTGISSGYINNSYLNATQSNAFSLTALLADLSEQIARISATEPIARHRVQGGDTLQKLAVKFYNDKEQWSEIYDHNQLQSSDLELIKGEVIEIPRVD